MRAMILAAGMGSRLLPLTAAYPKCLMPVANQPLLALNLNRLLRLGTETVVINTHHLHRQVEDFAAACRNNILLSHEPELLGSGGALVKARNLLGKDPFLVSNADIIHNLDLSLLAAAQRKHNLIACLGLTRDPRFNSVAIDRHGFLLGIKGYQPLPSHPDLYTFTGLACLSPRLLDYLPSRGVSSIVDAYLRALRGGEKIMGIPLPGRWDDLGAWHNLWEANARAAGDKAGPRREKQYILTAPGAEVAAEAVVEGFCFLSAGAKIEAGSYVRDSVLLPEARVRTGSRVERSILGRGFTARGSYHDGAFA
ncbi:MAG: NTP transferase domain-containing protein [Desulfarculales bacterium]|jgi:NDP-sugar pyrophosphorylase family protein|nr:NTP transferase domain-containing protein [Desulfarculales bacterium]